METKSINDQRRDFIKKSLGMTGIFLCAGSLTTLLDSCSSNPVNSNLTGSATLDISTVPELAAAGGVTEKTFSGQFDSKPIIIIRDTETNFLAFSTVCTHEGNKVNKPVNATNDLVCPAHNSHFSPKTGARISGPASSGLQKFNTSFATATNILTITG
jgi:Rieske Fe-S protein